MTSNPCHGLLRVRTAEARNWKPLWPHFRAQLAGVRESVRQVLPHIAAILRCGPITHAGLACRLLVLGQSTRKGLYNRQQRDILKDLEPLCRRRAWLARLARMAATLNAGGGR